jgi:hypothetical protein
MNYIVVVKLGTSTAEISQGVAVRRVENMAPVLFLFLLSAFAKSLGAIWEENSLKMIDCTRPTEAEFNSGKSSIKNHKASEYKSSKLESTKTLHCLCVEDGLFFSSLENSQ